MNSDQFKRAAELFLQIKDMPPELRIAAVAGQTDDLAVRGEVLRLLSSLENPTPFESLAGDVGLLSDVLKAVQGGELDQTIDSRRLAVDGPGTTIGRYHLLQLIGEGGFGRVFMAEQEQPVRRRVALKVIKLGMDTEQVIARFEAERQALAMMDHPNIAKVFDGGSTDSGRPYFVMELVKGVPITQYCDLNKVSARQRLELFLQVCHAVQHAHQKGVIHRDLKPSNVLVTLHDGTPVPKVIDFGIAKATQARLTERTLFTEFRQLVGTPEYMSPEQAEMSGLDVDTRSDVYSLGVLLYELLTGSTPLDGKRLRSAAYDEMQRMIREAEPPKPSTRLSTLGNGLLTIAAQRSTVPAKLGQTIRGDLDWIVMKALEKDRTRRYDAPSALAADIRKHLENEPVSAGPPTFSYKLRKFAQRKKGLLVAAGTISMALIVGLLALSAGLMKSRAANVRIHSMYLSSEAARTEAQTQKARAEAALSDASAARSIADSRGYTASMAAVEASLRLHDAATARFHLERTPTTLRGFEWNYLNYLSDPSLSTWHAEDLAASCLPVDANWKLMATGSAGSIEIWSLDRFERQRVLGDVFSNLPPQKKPGAISLQSLAMSRDGRLLAAFADCQLPLQVLDTSSGKQVASLDLACGNDDGFAEVVFSPDGTKVAAAIRAKKWHFRFWNLATGALVWAVDDEANLTSAEACGSGFISFDQDGTRLVTPGSGNALHFRDTTDGHVLLTIPGTSSGALPVAFSPNGSRIASGSSDGAIRILDTRDGHELKTMHGQSERISAIAWHPDGTRITAGSGKTVLVWDVERSENASYSFDGHRSDVSFVQFSADGKRILSSAADRMVKVWNAADEAQAVQKYLNGPGINRTVVSPTEPLAVTSGMNDQLRFWNTRTGELLGFRPTARTVATPTFSHDGKVIAIVGAEGAIEVHDAHSYQNLTTIRPEPNLGLIWDIALSPDGSRVAVSGTSTSHENSEPIAELRIFEVFSGREVARLKGHAAGVRSIAWSLNGKWLASADLKSSVRVWDIANAKEVYTIQENINTVEFSHNSKWLLTSGSGGRLALRDASTGSVLLSSKVHSNEVHSAHFSPDDRRIVCCGDDPVVKLLATDSLDALLILELGKYVPRDAGFSSDGKSIIASCWDHVRVWHSEAGIGASSGLSSKDLRPVIPTTISSGQSGSAKTTSANLSTKSGAEVVMSPGMRITAATPQGTIAITAGNNFERSFTWAGATRSVVLWPRKERWYGNLGLYYPGPGEHWKEHDGVTRAVVEEGQQWFGSADAALDWLKQRTWMQYVYRNDGLVVGWSKMAHTKTLYVEVWQIYVNSGKPRELTGSQNDKISVETAGGAATKAAH